MRLPFNGEYRVTQRFGENPAYYKKFGLKGHNGIDYALPLNTPVLAAEDGTATIHQDPELGNFVMVMGQHKTLYCHLTRATIANGQKVKAGEQVGLSGNTGNSTGPHLHFGVKPIPQDNNNGFGGAIDPEPLIGDDMAKDFNEGDVVNVAAVTGLSEDLVRSKHDWNDVAYSCLIPTINELRKKLGSNQAAKKLANLKKALEEVLKG